MDPTVDPSQELDRVSDLMLKTAEIRARLVLDPDYVKFLTKRAERKLRNDVLIPDTPLEELNPRYTAIEDYSRPIHILLPSNQIDPRIDFDLKNMFALRMFMHARFKHQQLFGHDNNPYFEEFSSRDTYFADIPVEPSKNKFRREIQRQLNSRQGMVTINNSTVQVVPGLRRPPVISEEKIAEGLFYLQFEVKSWYGRFVKLDLYPERIVPHVKDLELNNPIDWATERMRILLGYATRYAKRDCPVGFLEHAYKEMASIVCNPEPENLIFPRKYHLDKQTESILEAAKAYRLPENVIFLCELKDHLTPEVVRSEVVQRFLRTMPKMLHNGLNIDRVLEFIDDQIEFGLDPFDSIQHGLKLTVSVYSGLERPWWFKEDFEFSFVKEFDLSPRELESLAQEAGFSFQHVVPVYAEFKGRLNNLPGIGLEETASLVISVVNHFGIGSPKRAAEVLEFAVEALREADVSDRKALIPDLIKLFERNKPGSEILARLEGEDVNFDKPGIMLLYSALVDPEAVSSEKVNFMNLTPDYIRELGIASDKPLRYRALAMPALAITAERGALTLPHSVTQLWFGIAKRTDDTIQGSSRLDCFDKQLQEECFRSYVQQYLLLILAPSKPSDPMRPLKGFLRFI
ncbi:MAG: hypothetical protein R3A13_08515 [Bdellovibrionota bacterium]